MEEFDEAIKKYEQLERIYEEQKFYNEEVKVDIEKKALKKGVKKGRKDVINELISNGMPKEELSKYLSTPIV